MSLEGLINDGISTARNVVLPLVLLQVRRVICQLSYFLLGRICKMGKEIYHFESWAMKRLVKIHWLGRYEKCFVTTLPTWKQ